MGNLFLIYLLDPQLDTITAILSYEKAESSKVIPPIS